MRVARMLVTALSLLTVAACETVTTGQPRPAETVSRPAETKESTSETKDPEYSLARLCELLSSEESQSLGGSPEGEKRNSTADGHELCAWSDETSLVIGWQSGTSTAQADTGPDITNTPTTIDGLPAVQSVQTDPVVICEILVDLPSGKLFAASASVLSRGEGKYDPCQLATQMTTLIIPRVRNQ